MSGITNSIRHCDRRNPCWFFIVVLFVVVLPGCGGSSGGGAITPVVTVSPEEGATGVDRNAIITAAFGEDKIASTINDSSFYLTGSTLTGDSLVSGALSFNAINNVASFTSANELSLLGSYRASLSDSITDMSGNPLPATSWQFRVRDGLWATAALIERNNTGHAFQPEIAVDVAGNVLAVWYLSDGTVFNIWSNYYSTDTGWGTAEKIESDDAGDAVEAQVAFDANGNALAVWRQFDGAVFNIWSNRYVVGVGWGTAEKIESIDTGGAFEPQISIDIDGNALSVWYQTDGVAHSIWSNRYVAGAGAGTGWGAAVEIEAEPLGHAFSPQIAFDVNGNALAVWYQNDGMFNIWSNRYVAGTGAGTGWGAAELIENEVDGDAFAPQVSFGLNGNALAVWRQSDGVVFNIGANRYTAGIGWDTAAKVGGNDAGDAFAPQVAIDDSGDAILVWSEGDGTRSNIWSNRYTDGAGWGTAVKIESNDAGDTESAQIAMDARGNALAVWAQNDGTRYDIWSNRYVAGQGAGAGWGTASIIDAGSFGAFAPQIGIDLNGNGLAVWRQSDSVRNNILFNRFD